VTNLVKQVEISGTLAYELGTRNTSTVLQLKDGQTQVLAGLISDEDRRSANRIPGISEIPVIGRLFGTQGDDRRKTEIVLLITPRIVRTLNWNQTALIDVPVGTDAAIGAASLRIAQTGPGTIAMAPGAGAGGQAIGQPGVPLPRPPLPPSAGSPQAGGVPGLPGEEEAPAAGGPTALAQPPGAGVGSLLLAAPLAARAGAEVLVSLALAPGSAAQRATAELVYDPLQLEPVGAPTSSPGRVPVRIEGSAALRFRVLTSAGRAQVRIENAVGLDNSGNNVPLNVPGPVDITITP
jgi:general secretion pathway protein D